MDTWFITIKTWEPDGEGYWKTKHQETIPVLNHDPYDLPGLLHRLAFLVDPLVR